MEEIKILRTCGFICIAHSSLDVPLVLDNRFSVPVIHTRIYLVIIEPESVTENNKKKNPTVVTNLPSLKLNIVIIIKGNLCLLLVQPNACIDREKKRKRDKERGKEREHTYIQTVLEG